MMGTTARCRPKMMTGSRSEAGSDYVTSTGHNAAGRSPVWMPAKVSGLTLGETT
jgi:hypothetical protein